MLNLNWPERIQVPTLPKKTRKSKPRRKTVSTSLAVGKTKRSTRLFSDDEDEEDMIKPVESPLLNPIVSSISNKPAEQSLHKAGMRSRRSHSLPSTLYAETPCLPFILGQMPPGSPEKQENVKRSFVDGVQGEEVQGDEKRLQVQTPQKMCAKYLDPDHLKQLNSLPLRNYPIFVNVPGSIPISKNRQLSILLHSGKEAEKLVKLIKATPEEYKILTGRDLEEVVVTDGRVDSIDDLSIHTKSNSWIKQLGGVYKKITVFVEDNPEFRYHICCGNLDISTCQ